MVNKKIIYKITWLFLNQTIRQKVIIISELVWFSY
jgi:hypothetical protein